MANLSPVLVAWYVPPVVMAARVNMPSGITYPIQDITFDTVTTGAFGDCEADMLFTLGSAAGLDDYGRGRLRAAPTSTVLKVGRSSQGTEDGQLNVVDNAYITVYEDYRVWAKVATIIDYVEYKDSDLAVSDNTEEPPPICNMGSDCARRIDDTAGTLQLFFAGSASIAVADSATIASYAWTIDANSAFALGTTATDDDVFIDFDPGWHWVTLTVTDSNGKTATGRRLVYAYDPDDPDTIQTIKRISLTRTQQGSSCQIELVRPLLRSDYPDGGHVLIWEDRETLPIPASRDDQLFTGWHQVDQASSRALETHLQKETRLTLVDVLGRLDSLPGWPQRVEVPTAADLVDPGMNWGYMPTANMDKFLHYLLHWHSTADGVADFYPSDTWETYPFVIFDSGGATLYEQLQRQANRIVPDHNFTCDRFGAMRVVVDPILQPVADRDPDNDGSVTQQGISAIDFGYQRPPRVHTLRGSALATQTAWLTGSGGEKELETPFFSIAPGTAPGQGGREATIGERLAISQDALNDCVGQHYARMNARYGEIRMTPNLNSGLWSIDPASHRFTQVILAEEYLAQRGTDFFTVRALPKEVNIEYTPGEQALSRRGTVTFELETQGLPALTETHEPVLPVDEQPAPPPPFVPSDPTDPNDLFGDIAAYVMWDGNEVVRTWDLQDASPTWEEITGSITGTIFDCQYMMVDADTVGAWCLTDGSVFFTGDIMDTPVTWTEVLTIAEVRATAVAPASGTVDFACMTHYWSQPGHLIVAMTLSTEDDNYLHSYYWVTEDYGDTWTPVDMDDFTFTSDGATRCYWSAGRYGLASFRTAPGTIWCGRSNGRTLTNGGDCAIFKSTDLGYTWTKEFTFAASRVPSNGNPAILNPYPDATDASYLAVSRGGTSPVGELWKSTDGWDTASQVTEPASHSGAFVAGNHLQRPNKNPFDDQHVLAIFAIDASSNGDLYESNDGGSNWTLLENLNNSKVTPNGWPPDPDQWVLIDNSATPRIQLTLDNFGSLSDKTGNLASVITWTTGAVAGGFALPKVGLNRGDVPFPGMSEVSTGVAWEYLGEKIYAEGGAASTANGSQSMWISIHPPANIVRVKVQGEYECTYTKSGGLADGFARFELGGAGLTMTSDIPGDVAIAPENGTDSGSYEVEWERDLGEEWSVSKEEAISSPPSAATPPSLRAYCISTSAQVSTSVNFTARIVEMEDEDATIYTY